MKLLLDVAKALSAAYRIILYSWLITVLVHQIQESQGNHATPSHDQRAAEEIALMITVTDIMTVGDVLSIASSLISFGMGIIIGWAFSYNKHRKIVAKLMYERIKGQDIDAIAVLHNNIYKKALAARVVVTGGPGRYGPIPVRPPDRGFLLDPSVFPDYVKAMTPKEKHDWMLEHARWWRP
jgi:hypothetical protein